MRRRCTRPFRPMPAISGWCHRSATARLARSRRTRPLTAGVEALQGRRLRRCAGARHASRARGYGAGALRCLLHGSVAAPARSGRGSPPHASTRCSIASPRATSRIAAALASGEAAESAGDYAAALRIYERIADQKAAVTDDVLSRLARVALAVGDRAKAAAAYVRVYYEFPLTDAATLAGAQLAGLQDQIKRTGYKLDLGRAQLLFGAQRYAEARTAFQNLQRVADGDDKELVDLRVAECDFQLKRYAAARDGCAVPGTGLPQSRSAVLSFQQPPRARRSRAVHRADRRPRRRLSGQLVGRGGAEQSRHTLHQGRRRRAGGEHVQGAVREVPDGHAFGARRMEVRMVELQEGRLSGDGAGVRERRAPRSLDPTIGRRSCIGPPARTPRSERARRRTPGCGSSTPTTPIRTTAGSPSVISCGAPPCRQKASGSRRGTSYRCPPRRPFRPTA